jgi:hypothetical protein
VAPAAVAVATDAVEALPLMVGKFMHEIVTAALSLVATGVVLLKLAAAHRG